MGIAKILDGGEDGRYTIELDFGKALRDAALAHLAAAAVKLANDLDTVKDQIAESQEKIDELRLIRQDAVNAYIEAAETLRETGQLPPGSPTLDTKAIDVAAAAIRRADAAEAPLRRRRDAIIFLQRAVEQDIVRWNSIVAVSIRQAWCTTLKEDAPAGSYVATCDIPGDSNLVLLAPDCRPWTDSDGYLRGRGMMSPEQSFWCAAVQPGWQKFKPTYRWGTATAINYDDDTMDVALFDQTSDALRLPVNQSSTLTDVPVEYMTCNAVAFEIDDRVVVRFDGQDWSQPKVIGFLDNPRPCSGWVVRLVGLSDGSIAGPNRYLHAVFKTISTDAKITEAMTTASTIDADFRVDSGDWIALVSLGGSIAFGRTWRNQLNGNGASISGLFVSYVPPGSLPTENGAAFIGSPGAPAHIRISVFIDSGWAPTAEFAPFYAQGSIIEFRLRLDGLVYADIAVRSSFSPFAIDSGSRIPDAVPVDQLDYVRFVEEGA